MKLYFYFLEPYGIEMEECEVIENPKTYKPVTKFPHHWYYQTVSKNKINILSDSITHKVVILTESDNERVSELFMLYLENERERNNQKIQDATENIRNIDDKLKMIEKWRESNL